MEKITKTIANVIFVTLIAIVAYLLSGLLIGQFGEIDSDIKYVVSYSTPMLLMLLGVVIYDRVVCKRAQRTMWSIRGFNPSMILWGVLLLVSLSIVLSPLMRLLPTATPFVETEVWAVVTVICIAPIIEEVLFRAKIFSLFRSTLSPTLSAVVTSAIFALMHGFTGVAIEAFLAGMIFSYAYIATGSIFAPIILHIFNNVMAFVMMQFMYQERTISDYIGALESFDIIYAVALLITIIGLIAIVRKYRLADRVVREGGTLSNLRIEERNADNTSADKESDE